MSRTAFIISLAALSGLACIHPVQADGPDSRDRQSSGPTASGPHDKGGSHSRHSHRGPMRHGYGWPGRSSISLFVGAAPGYFSSGYFAPRYYYGPMFGYGGYYPLANYAYWGPTGIYFDSATNHAEYYLPPVYAPAELAYGPLAVERFLGVRRDPIAAPAAGLPAADIPAAGDPAADDEHADALAPRLRKSNDAARQRAFRFLAFGDALFAQQRFHEALQRYKSAVEAAPDLALAYYRQGFALITVSQYRLATKALRIAVELDPGLPRGEFQLDHLYKDNQLAKIAHLEQLSGKALERSDDGDMLFLVGMFLFCDGNIERAEKFLRKAADLGGVGASFIAPLLEAPPVPAASEPGEAVDTEIDI